MKITINSVKFDADQKLEDYVEKKVNKLEKFYDEIVHAEVYLRVEKPQAVDNKITEIKLEIPGTELFAKKQSQTFEESTEQAIDALRKQLIKHKEKIRG